MEELRKQLHKIWKKRLPDGTRCMGRTPDSTSRRCPRPKPKTCGYYRDKVNDCWVVYAPTDDPEEISEVRAETEEQAVTRLLAMWAMHKEILKLKG